MNKVPLILFSGGLDSSHLLASAMQTGNVETLYIDCGIHPFKKERELLAREKIISTLQKATGNYVITDHCVKIDQLFTCYPQATFQQALMWLVGALQISNSNKHSELRVGYVAGDQISSLIPNIEQAWHHMQAICKSESIPVVFPLKFMRKIDILNRIRSDIVQKVWTCEAPEKVDTKNDYVICKRCPACQTIAAALHVWNQSNGYPYWWKVVNRLPTTALVKTKKVASEAVDEVIEVI